MKKVPKNILYLLILLFSFSANLLSKSLEVVNSDAPFVSEQDWDKYYNSVITQKYNLIPNKNFFKPKVALVLSGGGARGIAHIGVIKQLEKSNIKIDYIVGTSIGAIIGGLYSAGYTTDELENIFMDKDWTEIFSLIENIDRREYIYDNKAFIDRRLLKLTFRNFEVVFPQGLSFANKFNQLLSDLFYNARSISLEDYDDLQIPFRPVATDIVSGNIVILKNGSLPMSVRASSTIPLRHSPVPYQNMLLVDGGLMSNIPVSIATREFNPDITIAVDVTSPLFEQKDLNKPWNVADQIVSIEMQKFTEIERNKANFLITPDLGNYSNTDFKNTDSLINKGEIAATDVAKNIKLQIEHLTNEKFNDFNNDNPAINNEYSSIKFKNIKPIDSANITKLFNSTNLILLDDIYQYFNSYANSYCKLWVEANQDEIIINANEQTQLTKVVINHRITPKLEEILSEINQKFFAEQFDFNLMQKVKIAFLDKAKEKNYSFLDIKKIICNKENKIFELIVDEGIVDSVIIEGNQTVDDYLIKRELKFKQGDILSFQMLQQCRANLLSTNYFSFIDVYPTKNASGKINVIVQLTESGNQTLQLGIRADNERYLQASVDFLHQNFLNLGSQVAFSFFGGELNQYLSITGFNPKILTTTLTSRSIAYYYRNRIKLYDNTTDYTNKELLYQLKSELLIEKMGLNLSFGSQIEKKGKFTFDLKYERQRYFSIGEVPSLFQNLATFKINFQYDSRDFSFYAKNGMEVESYLETNIAPISDFISYSKLFFSFSSFYSFDSRNTINFGSIIGAGDETMPITEMFSLGGEGNFLGLLENQYIGRQIVNIFVNYRYRIPIKSILDMYVGIHYNTGRVWQRTDKIQFVSFLHSLGLSYSFNTPLGPLSIGIADLFSIDESLELYKGEAKTYLSFGIKL